MEMVNKVMDDFEQKIGELTKRLILAQQAICEDVMAKFQAEVDGLDGKEAS